VVSDRKQEKVKYVLYSEDADMPDASTKEAMTNTTPKSCVDLHCDCNTMWSLAQQFSMRRLCIETGEHTGELLNDYAVRARRIAATYARFYLELEDGGDPSKRGRYYWMALGAFASKTVACTFEAWQVRTMTLITDSVWEGLGKGNLWLFCDISGWHWYHSMYRNSFAKCISERNSRRYIKQVKEQMESLPWTSKALPIIKHMAVSDHVREGFRLVDEFERTNDITKQRRIQLKHLMAIANHEQGVILQPLIYADSNFSMWVRQQRAPYASWASPALKLVFTHACGTKTQEMQSVAPADTELEDLKSRMVWITAAAVRFHELMDRKKENMLSELSIIAGWVNLEDRRSTFEATSIAL
jgi:hypothetical protein